MFCFIFLYGFYIFVLSICFVLHFVFYLLGLFLFSSSFIYTCIYFGGFIIYYIFIFLYMIWLVIFYVLYLYMLFCILILYIIYCLLFLSKCHSFQNPNSIIWLIVHNKMYILSCMFMTHSSQFCFSFQIIYNYFLLSTH